MSVLPRSVIPRLGSAAAKAIPLVRGTLPAQPAFRPHGSVEELLERAERNAERIIALTRIGVAVALLVVLAVSAEVAKVVYWSDFLLRRGLLIGFLTASGFLLTGILALVLIQWRLFRPWMTWAFVTLDAVVTTFSIGTALSSASLSGSYISVLPPVFIIPILLAVGALRYRPGVQVYLTVLLCAGLVLLARMHEMDFARPAQQDIARYFALPPNLVRFAMLAVTGAVTVLVVVRASRILREAIRRTLDQANLARFLPAEMVDALRLESGDLWRTGRRQIATIVFVDIRGSTALAEPMDPMRLSIFISSFRRRVMKAAQTHGALVDKFVGDGALLLFGVPDASADDAARAVAFGHRLQAMIARWNAKRRFDPPLRVGIGIHTGEVFVGLVGTEQRLEFTVLGDSVNVAARLEQATKDFPADLIISGETLRAAGLEGEGWHRLALMKLRGRGDDTELYAPPSPEGSRA